MSRHPNFLCVGAGKSDMTAMHHMWHQHPEMFLPKQMPGSDGFLTGTAFAHEQIGRVAL